MKVIIDKETEKRASEVKPMVEFVVAWYEGNLYFLRKANTKGDPIKYVWQSFGHANNYSDAAPWPAVIKQFDSGDLSIHSYQSLEHFCKDYIYKAGRK